MRNIEQALKEHKQRVLDAGYAEWQIMGIFLYGSQNYGVQTENSDIDTKCIIIPSIRQLMFEPIQTKELRLYNDEHCEVMDIMHLIKNFTKQNINFLEVLYTDYCWINPIYETYWFEYFTMQREKIVHYDKNKAIQSICGQAIHTLKQNPYDSKKISNGLRLQCFLNEYIAGSPYDKCIKPEGKDKERIMEFKKHQSVITDDIANNLIDWFEDVKCFSIKNDTNSSEYTLSIMQSGALAMVGRCQRELAIKI